MAKKTPMTDISKTPASEDIPANAAEYKKGIAKWLPMAILGLALMIIIVDTTVLNVSLKVISNDLHTNLQGLQWVITAYALTLAAFTITGGRLGDLFGRKKMFMLGAIIFAGGSFITSISHSVGMMLAGESIIEGFGAALMMPATASLLVANYKGRDRAIAFGIWGGIAGASSAIGPIVGGYLTTNYSWRWAFRINIGVALLLLAGSFLIAESRDQSEKRELDFLGVFLSATGLLAFVYGIIEAPNYGWLKFQQAYQIFGHNLPFANLSVTPMAMTLGVVLLVLFALWERNVEKRGHTPLVSLRLFANKQFTSGASTVALMSLGMTGMIFAVPVFLQSVQNLDALHTGLALLPLSLAVLIVAPASAILAKHFTAKRIIQTGLLLTVIASAIIHFLLGPNATGLALFGMGMGLVFAQASNLTLSAVSVDQAGEASGVNNTMRQVGSTFGSAIIGAVVLTTLASGLVHGIVSSPKIPDNVRPKLAAYVAKNSANAGLDGVQVPASAGLPKDINTTLAEIAHQASADASRKAMLYTSVFMLGALAVSTMLPNVKDLDHHANTKEKETSATA
jgi:EmrB/QacA subfamily drug resistance transporter